MCAAMEERTNRGRVQADARRGLGMRPVADMLPSISGAACREFGFVQSAIVSRWAEIMGADYVGVSAPEAIRFPPGKRSDGVLSVIVEGEHAPIIQNAAPAILERINHFFGYPAVTRVTIRRSATVSAEPRRSPSSPSPLPGDMSERLRAIADPELHAILSSLAAGVVASEAAPAIDGHQRENDA